MNYSYFNVAPSLSSYSPKIDGQQQLLREVPVNDTWYFIDQIWMHRTPHPPIPGGIVSIPA